MNGSIPDEASASAVQTENNPTTAVDTNNNRPNKRMRRELDSGDDQPISSTMTDKDELLALIDGSGERISYKKVNKKSEFWPQFREVWLDGTQQPFMKCIKCSKLLAYAVDGKGGTSGLSKHFKSVCVSEKAAEQSKVAKLVVKKLSEKAKERLTRAASVCSAIDMRAFSMYQG